MKSLPRFSVENPVLVNMCMLVILVGGFGFYFTLVKEMFPESRPDQITITAIYPAVQPDDIEKAVTIKIEEAVRDIDSVEKVESTVKEGQNQTIVTLYNEVNDVDAVLQEVKNEVDAIEDLPDDVEQITIRKLEPTLPVISVALYGQGSEQELKQAARQLRDDLLELPGISDIQLGGIRDDEISIEIQPDKLYEYDITLREVAVAIGESNLDVSGGNLKGDRSNVSVRVIGEETDGADLGNIVIRSDVDGRKIYLHDIATITDGFVDTELETYFNGEPSVNLTIEKTSSQDALDISSLVRAYIAGKKGVEYDANGFAAAYDRPWYFKPFAITGTFLSWGIDRLMGKADPQTVYEQSLTNPFDHNFKVELYSDLSRFVSGRLDLMTRNGQSGLILVLISLNLFLNWRVAFWAAVGMPVSFMGTFIVMSLFGVSINLLSMFGIIIVLGIIVDDAIVIGENIFRHVEEGMPAHEAAIKGAEEVMWPVIVAVCTTIAAFLPLMFIQGRIGDFFRELPLVVLAALSVSLIEALIILPTHLSHLPAKVGRRLRKQTQSGAVPPGIMGRFRSWQASFTERVFVKNYERLLRLALHWRYVTVCIATSTLIISFGMFAGGIVPFVFIQKMDSETVIGAVEMPVGTVMTDTRERLLEMAKYAETVPEVRTVQTYVGLQIAVGGAGSSGGQTQSHLGQIILELEAADVREEKGLRSSEEVLVDLRNFSQGIPGTNSVTWEAFSGGPAGKDIEIRVSGDRFEDVLAAGTMIEQELSTYDGVVDITDDHDSGKREVQLQLKETARPTGMSTQELGNFVRFALYGAEARRITRNREDVKIMVRFPEEYRKSVYHIESLWIPSPTLGSAAGQNAESRWIPVSEVARIEETDGYTTIHRAQQDRSVSVEADVDSAVANLDEVMLKFEASTLSDIQTKYPNLKIELLGTSEERKKSFSGLFLAFPMALLLIYLMLAGLFKSYFQPLVVMAAIPFGFEGAVVGHWVTDNPFTILSCIGFVALTGIVVNDSLVLVDFVNTRIRQGMPVFEATVKGSSLRLRAILLTTLTTAAGLTPLMFETSFQAKFLIPMAVTLTYGLIFATALTLIVVPCMNMIYFDCITRFKEAWCYVTFSEGGEE